MDDIVIARVLHILAIVHWIGGVAFVTLVVLPAIARLGAPAQRIALFEQVEGRFSLHAKASVLLAGASGFYMTWRMEAWYRLADIHFWWMHAMIALWAVFSIILFVAEPLWLHAWFHRRAATAPESTFALVQRLHRVLLALAVVTVAGAGLGAHGVVFQVAAYSPSMNIALDRDDAWRSFSARW
jgi:uncharacterized membrane protein